MEDLLGVLKADERDLVREVESERLELLDEEELLALHKRIRRARNKHTKNYRRTAADGVVGAGGRGAARPRQKKRAQRAEVFEEALARVSVRLAVVAAEAAEDLKSERLSRARAGKSAGPGGQALDEHGTVGAGRTVAYTRSPDQLKNRSSSQAAGNRRQAKRDSR